MKCPGIGIWWSSVVTLGLTSMAPGAAIPETVLPAGVRIDAQATAFFQRTNGWVAGDGAISVPLHRASDKHDVLWLFGDSHLDDLDTRNGTVACLFQCRNAGLLQEQGSWQNATTLAGERPGFMSWLKHSTNNNEWLWPISGVQDRERVLIYAAALRTTPQGGQWGFESIGHDYLVELKLHDLHRANYLPLPAFNGIGFGQGFIREGKFVYAFGSKQRKLGSDVFVARFNPAESATDWSFWDGRRWSGSVSKAAVIASASSTSVQVCKVRNKYLLCTSAFSVACDQGRAIYVRTSDKLTGPFSELREICEIPDQFQGHVPFFYFPSLHPEYINEQDEILLTYSINKYEPCIPACKDGRAIAEHYRPKALRVKLARIL
jgi:hypothetical protein